MRHKVFLFITSLLTVLCSAEYYGYEVKETIYHDKGSFVEGLLFLENGHILESVGLTGRSKLLLYDKTGVEKASYSNTKREFAEGITLFSPLQHLFPASAHDKYVAQLTYKAKLMHFYSLTELSGEFSFEKVGQAKLPKEIKEGWGLTSSPSGETLVMSDGSSSLYFLELSRTADEKLHLKIAKTVSVHDCANEIPFLQGMNELELVPASLLEEATVPNPFSMGSVGAVVPTSKSHIWTNIIGTWCIAVIDLETGEVTSWINLRNLDKDFSKFDRVANGIAYNYRDGSLWVSGKKWKRTYRVELTPLSSFNPSKECKTPWRTQRSQFKVSNC